MRKDISHIEAYRVRTGPLASTNADGANGAFFIPCNDNVVAAIASDGRDWKKSKLPGKPWQHVSVSLQHRCPTWDEMAYVKSLFFRPEELVLQFHVPAKEHINIRETCLHLWKPPFRVELPPSICV